jgi:hypothetical protein
MKFVCVGSEPTAIGLLREILASDCHTLLPCALSGALAQSVFRESLPVRRESDVEVALHLPDADVVIVAVEETDLSLHAARSAAQSDRHVVVFPPVNCSPAMAFELHLIFDESRRSVIPVTGRWQLSELPLQAHHLPLNRENLSHLSLMLPVSLNVPGEVASSADRQDAWRRSLERGVDVLTAADFPYSQVTALDALAPGGEFLSRQVTLNGPGDSDRYVPPATLTLRAARNAEADPSAVLTVTNREDARQEFVIVETQGILPRIEHLCGHRADCTVWLESFATCQELSEAVSKSLRRRRTVDVHFDTGSERGVFKSQMTALGCGVLVWMLVVMVGYLTVASVFEIPDWLLHAGRVIWIAPLVLFLLVQLLLPVARGRSSSR